MVFSFDLILVQRPRLRWPFDANFTPSQTKTDHMIMWSVGEKECSCGCGGRCGAYKIPISASICLLMQWAAPKGQKTQLSPGSGRINVPTAAERKGQSSGSRDGQPLNLPNPARSAVSRNNLYFVGPNRAAGCGPACLVVWERGKRTQPSVAQIPNSRYDCKGPNHIIPTH